MKVIVNMQLDLKCSFFFLLTGLKAKASFKSYLIINLFFDY